MNVLDLMKLLKKQKPIFKAYVEQSAPHTEEQYQMIDRLFEPGTNANALLLVICAAAIGAAKSN